jgi:hypothetical protein
MDLLTQERTSKCYEEVFQELDHSLNESIKFYLLVFTANEFEAVIDKSTELFVFPEHGHMSFEIAGFSLVNKQCVIMFKGEIMPCDNLTTRLADLSIIHRLQLLKSLENVL